MLQEAAVAMTTVLSSWPDSFKWIQQERKARSNVNACLTLWVCEGHGKVGCPTAVYKHDQSKCLSHCHSFCLSVYVHTLTIRELNTPCLSVPVRHVYELQLNTWQNKILFWVVCMTVSCPGIPERCCWQAVSAVQHTHTGHTEVKAGWH